MKALFNRLKLHDGNAIIPSSEVVSRMHSDNRPPTDSLHLKNDLSPSMPVSVYINQERCATTRSSSARWRIGSSTHQTTRTQSTGVREDVDGKLSRKS